MYMFQEIIYPLVHFFVQKNTDLWLRKIQQINPELRISKLSHEGVSGYL
jgi:hypothetical protein